MNLSEIKSAVKALLPALRVVPTRFRAYQLGNKGASFSLYDGKTFTLIEARLTGISRPNLIAELKYCKKSTIDTLHITSWDRDHCDRSELVEILATLRPFRIEFPGYEPSTECGKACKAAILQYCRGSLGRKGVAITPEYIKSLTAGSKYGYKDIVYHPKTLVDKANDNSTVKLYRTGCFNVLSLGDVESIEVAGLLKACGTACKEIDVLILPHHGAHNGFVTKDLLDELNPRLAVCAANHSNQYGHPAPEVRSLLSCKGIPVATTVRGDVIVWSDNGTSSVRWADTMRNTSELHKHGCFEPKKFAKLNQHGDNIRVRANPAPHRAGLRKL